jgi:hypothetical protein
MITKLTPAAEPEVILENDCKSKKSTCFFFNWGIYTFHRVYNNPSYAPFLTNRDGRPNSCDKLHGLFFSMGIHIEATTLRYILRERKPKFPFFFFILNAPAERTQKLRGSYFEKQKQKK